MDGETIDLVVDSLAHGGEGIARDADGRTLFIRGGCPGDRVRVHIVREHSRYARAEIVEVLDPSVHRVDPPCPHFGRCGGCQWQHVDQETQLAAKKRAVRDALKRIGGFEDPSVAETIASPLHLGYRNRIELTAGGDRRLDLGYTGTDGSTFVPVDRCLLLPGERSRAPRALRGALRYVSGDTDLGIVRVGVRVSEATGACEVDLWARPGPFPRGLVARTVSDALGADTVTRVIVRSEDGPRAVRKVEVLRGRGFWTERIGAHGFTVSAPSFFQVNTSAAEHLTRLVLEALRPGAHDRILDAFSGVGTFTLPLAAAGARVTAVESSRHALRDLERNLEKAGLEAGIVPGSVGRALDDLGGFDLLVVDPPRAGLESKTLTAIAGAGARRLVSVSCDPATFARDAGRFAERGYRLVSVTPVDLFPQTYHVEVVGVFDRV